jgi:hypothetical protein
MLQFAAPLQEHFGDEYEMYTAVSGGSHPTLVLWRDGDWKWFTVVHADPTCAKFTEEHIGTYLMTMVTFQGNIYYAGKDGQVFKFAAPAEPCDHELEQCNHELVAVAQMAPDMDVEGRRMKGNSAASYLVESNGQLLLVESRARNTTADEKERTQCFTRARGPIGGSWPLPRASRHASRMEGGLRYDLSH